jgi:hypothetical protein
MLGMGILENYLLNAIYRNIESSDQEEEMNFFWRCYMQSYDEV